MGHYLTLCWNTDSILGHQGYWRSPNLNPDGKNPYVWVQIEVLREGSFGPLSHALLEHRLYIEALRRPAGPQFEPRRKESLRLGSNQSRKGCLLGHYPTLCWNTNSILGRQSDRRGPNLNPGLRNPYVWVQIEIFWATTQTLGPNRGLLGQYRTLFWLLRNYHNCQTSKPPLTSKFRKKKVRRRKREEREKKGEERKKKEGRKREEREREEREREKRKRERGRKKRERDRRDKDDEDHEDEEDGEDDEDHEDDEDDLKTNTAVWPSHTIPKVHFNKCPFLSFLALTNNPTLKRHFNKCPFLSFLPLTNNPTLKRHFNKCPFSSFLALTNPKRTLQQVSFFKLFSPHEQPQKDTSTSVLFQAFWPSRTTPKGHFNKCPLLSCLALTNNPSTSVLF